MKEPSRLVLTVVVSALVATTVLLLVGIIALPVPPLDENIRVRNPKVLLGIASALPSIFAAIVIALAIGRRRAERLSRSLGAMFSVTVFPASPDEESGFDPRLPVAHLLAVTRDGLELWRIRKRELALSIPWPHLSSVRAIQVAVAERDFPSLRIETRDPQTVIVVSLFGRGLLGRVSWEHAKGVADEIVALRP